MLSDRAMTRGIRPPNARHKANSAKGGRKAAAMLTPAERKAKAAKAAAARWEAKRLAEAQALAEPIAPDPPPPEPSPPARRFPAIDPARIAPDAPSWLRRLWTQ